MNNTQCYIGIMMYVIAVALAVTGVSGFFSRNVPVGVEVLLMVITYLLIIVGIVLFVEGYGWGE